MQEPSEDCELLVPNEGIFRMILIACVGGWKVTYRFWDGVRSIGKFHSCIFGHSLIVQHSLYRPVLLEQLYSQCGRSDVERANLPIIHPQSYPQSWDQKLVTKIKSLGQCIYDAARYTVYLGVESR
jgi:hypothetical protein